jgi:hypothetical protein
LILVTKGVHRGEGSLAPINGMFLVTCCTIVIMLDGTQLYKWLSPHSQCNSLTPGECVKSAYGRLEICIKKDLGNPHTTSLTWDDSLQSVLSGYPGVSGFH